MPSTTDPATTFRVAIVQTGTVVFNTKATLEKLKVLTAEAAKKGAQLVLFPEAFVGGYITGMDFGVGPCDVVPTNRHEYERYFNAAVEYESAESDIIGETARQHNVYLVTGAIEREKGTLYCAVFFYGPGGKKLGKHRKVMPTALERVAWGQGDGSTMPVIDTSLGKMGAIICFENMMPLMRAAMYRKGIQLYIVPNAVDSETWQTTVRAIALEGRCFVFSLCQFLRASAFPESHPRHADGERILMRGGSSAYSPLGDVLLEPNFEGERVDIVECNMGELIRAKIDLDVAGHYSRPDIFQLTVNENRLQ
ncbi:carbon-nitrogen hydrolase domain-containing protein [Ditylenchus destructor]|uniref:Carbon-nitrogen hydrolase domain-containing protein n=1 Tax=Ditylenchus destructor TaxID=166010 RepID=A0AAD4MZF4_9BILA|nr:carbon-nitrogen hydrolase domain-containing protein [Ditylenchus destructor]